MVEGADDGPLAADSSAADSPPSPAPAAETPTSRPPAPAAETPTSRPPALLSPTADSPDSQPPESELSWPELDVPIRPPSVELPAVPAAVPASVRAPDPPLIDLRSALLDSALLDSDEVDSHDPAPRAVESSAGPPTPDPTQRELGFREPITEEVDSEVTLKPKLLSPVIVKEIARRESEGRLTAAVIPPPKLAAFSNLSSSNVAARPVVAPEETETLRREQPAVGADSDEITKLDHEAQMQALEKARLSRFPFPERITGPRPPSLHDDDESATSLPLSGDELFDGVEPPRKVGGTALLDLITPRRYAANSVLPRDVSVFIKEDSLEALPPLPPTPPSVLGRMVRWLFVALMLAGLSYGAFILGKRF